MRSMTGFATAEGGIEGLRWRWEGKSVNGRGLDMRFRLPEAWEGFEPAFRTVAAATIKRGNLAFSLRYEAEALDGALTLNPDALRAAMEAARQAEDIAAAAGVHLAPATITDFLALRGVTDAGAGAAFGGPDFEAESKASFQRLVDALEQARAEEGARLCDTFLTLVAEIEVLSLRAATLYDAQQDTAPARLAQKVAALIGAGADIAPDRLAMELALLAVKADIREELDRLTSHIAAARALLRDEGPVGRKLDFLTQEFNREVNTLCSKSGSPELTAIGLALKVAIDQLREQAQNVE